MGKARLAIFASGTGSNALNLVKFFTNHADIEVSMILSNKVDAPVVSKAKDLGMSVEVINNEQAADAEFMIETCQKHQTDFIALAGYLRKIPAGLIQSFPNKIFNVHPALLPKFGGPGMYGMNVHRAVVEQKEKESGMTVHYVNENYDEGARIAQFYCPVTNEDTPEIVQQKVQVLEHAYFATVIEKSILNA